MMSPPHFGIHSKPFRPRFMAAQDLFHHAALIYARKKFTKTRSAGRLFSFTASPCGPRAAASNRRRMFTCIKIKHTTTGGHQKLAHADIVKKTSKDEVQIFSTQMRFLRVAVYAFALSSFSLVARLLNYYRRYF
jgi:hypothetical protein